MNCTICGKAMKKAREETSQNPATGAHYSRTVFACMQDDVWITLEVPKTDAPSQT